ncbi:unnamed protein product [Nyctereutes procyonoides]|uniref:(raccoon dog) hypothetical protein n=1 Tax=Nyctereutes procyonoides TaxID=34880 RepID=A0A811YUN5_NYCPR|nr:unnamed protein product [Nyctereutes procyonoides]
MFSCCLPTSRGSGFQKPQGRSFFTCQDFGSTSSTQEMGQEWEEEILCSTSLRNGKVPCIANRGQCGLKVSAGAGDTPHAGPQCSRKGPGSQKPGCYSPGLPPRLLLPEESGFPSSPNLPPWPCAQILEKPALAPEQHPEARQEPSPAPTMGPAEASGPGLIEPVMAAGAECLARVAMPAAESKPMHVMVTPRIHCPHLEEPPAPLATLEEDHALAPVFEVPDMLKQPPASVEQPDSAPEQHPESSRGSLGGSEATTATTVGPAEASGPEVIELVMALELTQQKASPPPLIALFLIFVVFINLCNGFMNFFVIKDKLTSYKNLL